VICIIPHIKIVQIESRFSDISWNLQQINIEGARDKTIGNSDIIMAVFDTGIDFSHPALAHSK
jgi:hypothetical protein